MKRFFSIKRERRRAGGPTTSVSGFTLIELLVSVGIFTLITTMAVFNHKQFNASVLLTNLAYDVALSIRQAQFYGIVVKQSTVDTSKFDSGYGVYIDMSNPTQYILYEDVKPTSGVADHMRGAGDRDLETYRLNKGNYISKFCVNGACSTTGTLNIAFIRPNPDAYIQGLNSGTAEICIAAPSGTQRKVTVESTGQISASTAACS